MAPRVFFVRHGETQWSKVGKHTGKTDLPLLPNGAKVAAERGRILFGPGKTIDPAKLVRIYCSPRKRAQQTMDLYMAEHKYFCEPNTIVIDERIAEWDYGDYEGLTNEEIYRIQGQFNIWKQGCPGGESPEDVTARLDDMIADIRKIHKEAMDNNTDGDVFIIGHGHILRAFAMRWINVDLHSPIAMILPTSGMGALSYEHENMAEPAILLI